MMRNQSGLGKRSLAVFASAVSKRPGGGARALAVNARLSGFGKSQRPSQRFLALFGQTEQILFRLGCLRDFERSSGGGGTHC